MDGQKLHKIERANVVALAEKVPRAGRQVVAARDRRRTGRQRHSTGAPSLGDCVSGEGDA